MGNESGELASSIYGQGPSGVELGYSGRVAGTE